MRHSPEIITRARQMYADSEATVADICRDCEISQYALYYWVDGGPPTGALHLEPLPRRGDKVARGGRLRRLRGGRVSLVKRIWRTAEAQVRAIEERLLRAAQPSDERERDARVLAVLGKTLRDLGAFDQTQADAAHRNDASRDNDHDAVPRDVDDLRRELARRVDVLRRRRAAAGAPGGDGA
jgi:hypothetical protein